MGVTTDLEGATRPQQNGYDIGAYEFTPALQLGGMPSNQAIHLSWSVNVALPPDATWQILYTGPAGDEPSPISGLPNPTRAYALTGLTNYTPYTITLNAMQAGAPLLTDTLTLLPSDNLLQLALVLKSP